MKKTIGIIHANLTTEYTEFHGGIAGTSKNRLFLSVPLQFLALRAAPCNSVVKNLKLTHMTIGIVIIFAALLISCGKKIISLPPPAPPPEQALQAGEAPETVFVTEDGETDEEITEENDILRRIIIPYAKEYLVPGQETRIMVHLENADYGDEMHFTFAREPGKNSIEIETLYNAAIIKAVREGEQYIIISHPKAPESRVIVYDVLPPPLPPTPDIDVSESPMIVRKGQTKPLQMILLNGNAADREKFQFQVVENTYAIEVKQQGSMLHITGIAPGAGKIRIMNPAALRDYDVMVIVD